MLNALNLDESNTFVLGQEEKKITGSKYQFQSFYTKYIKLTEIYEKL